MLFGPLDCLFALLVFRFCGFLDLLLTGFTIWFMVVCGLLVGVSCFECFVLVGVRLLPFWVTCSVVCWVLLL